MPVDRVEVVELFQVSPEPGAASLPVSSLVCAPTSDVKHSPLLKVVMFRYLQVMVARRFQHTYKLVPRYGYSVASDTAPTSFVPPAFARVPSA